MAWLVIASPGKKYGPCADPCQHKDCQNMRGYVEKKCGFCGERLGYDRRSSHDDDKGECHTSCIEDYYAQPI